MAIGLPEGGDTAVKTMLLLTEGWVGVVGQQETEYPQVRRPRATTVRCRMPLP